MNQNKKLAINMAANIVSYSSTVLIAFVLTPYLINNLGKEAYSFYPLTNNIISYMSIVMNALNAMASRYVTIALARNENEKANQYFTSVFFSNIIIAAIMCIPCLLFIVFIDSILSIPINLIASVRVLFALSMASAIVNISFSVFGIATFAKNRIDLRSLRELCMSILRILLFVLFFSLFQPSIIYVGVVAIIVALVGFCFQFCYTKKLLPEIKMSRVHFRFRYIKEILISSAWNIINSCGGALLTGTGLVLANVLYGAAQAAEYSIVQTVPTFINGVISVLAGVFYPFIMQAYAKGDKGLLLSELKRAQRLIGFFSTSVIGVFLGVSYYFFELWTPNQGSAWLVLLSTTAILPHAIIGCAWSLSNLSVAMNKVKIPALYVVGSGIVNVVLAYVCYRYTDVGLISIPLISAVIQIVWIGFFFPIYMAKELKVPITTFYPPILRGLGATFAALMISVGFTSCYTINSWLSFFIVGGFSGVVALGLNAFIMFDKQTWLRMLHLAIDKLKRAN